MSTYAPVRYEELVCNPTLFWDTLSSLLQSTGTNLRVPVMKGEKIDLHRLFIEVTSRGGMEKVIKDKKWKEVLRAISVAAAKRTNGSFYLRLYYLKFLYQFEQLYYLEKPVPSSQSKDEALKKLSIEGPCSEEGKDELKVGNVVEGFIDAKFNNGYIVTVKVGGSEEMKGVLYHVPETPIQSEQPMEKPLAIVPSSSQGRDKKKKAKMAVVDPEDSECVRINLRTDIGLYYFFAEQFDRLKPDFNGDGQALTREIKRIWSNLTESEKQVYKQRQGKSVNDV